MTPHAFNIAVLGLGAMGSRMAVNLIKAGHNVSVWNRSAGPTEALEKQGATVAATPRQAAQNASFVICMVRDDEASRQVWTDAEHGALAGMPPDAVAIDSSTLTPAWTQALAQLCAARGVAFVEAPVAGSRPQAEAGQLIYLVGGDAQWVARTEPVFKAMGSAVYHTGPAGSAAVVKLFVNSMFGIQLASLAELLGMAQKAGVDAARLLDIFSATPVASPAAKFAGAAMLDQNFGPQFPIELVAKDFAYVVQTALESNAELPITQSARAVVDQAIHQGLQNSNITALAKLYMG